MFIVLEGLDGVGKTTAAKLLAEKLGGSYLYWLQPPFKRFMADIWEAEDLSEAATHLAFLAAFRNMSEIVEKKRDAEIIVTDRYYFGSVAMHPALATIANEAPLDFDRNLLRFAKPDHSFYLVLDEEARRNRLGVREKLSPVEAACEANPELVAGIHADYRKLCEEGLMTELRIDGMTETEVVTLLFSQIST